MLYLVYILIVLTVCVFSFTSYHDSIIQALVNYIPKEVAFSIVGLSAISYSLISKKNNIIYHSKPLFVILALFTFQIFFHFYSNLLMVGQEGGYSFNLRIVRPSICFLIGVLLIKVFSESFEIKDWMKIFKFIAWTGFLLAAYSILQWFGIDWSNGILEKNFPNNVPSKKELMYTFLSHRTLSAAYIALTAPLCLMFKELKYKAFLVIMAISIMLSDSLIATGSFIVSICLFFILSKKLKTLIFVALLCVISLIFMNNQFPNFFATSGRIVLWKTVITDVLKNSPFVGFGLGKLAYKYNLLAGPGDLGQIRLFAHNEYVSALFYGGLPALIAVFWYVFNLLRKGFINIRSHWLTDVSAMCCLISVFIVSFGTFMFHYPPLAVLGILYIAYTEYRYLALKDETPQT